MNRKRIEKKYAKAFFEILISSEQYAATYEQLVNINSFFKAEPLIIEFLCNPINDFQHKVSILVKIQETLHLSPLTVKFINILITRHVLIYYSGITEELLRLYNDFKGIVQVEVTTAIPLRESLRIKLIKSLEKHTGKQVVMTHKIDERIIGGIITRINSVIYDGSIRRQLELIKEKVGRQ